MAITALELQTAIGLGNKNLARVHQTLPPYGATSQYWTIEGGIDHRKLYFHAVTTASDDAATQATSVLAQALALTRG